LLPAGDKLRFLPAPLWNGEADLLFVAWDGSQGSAGRRGNATLLGGGTPFSADGGDLAVTVTEVAHAPGWTASSTTLAPILPGTTDPAGESVQQGFGSVFVDPNASQPAGIAVTGLSGTTTGTWQYQLASSGSWQNFPKVSASAALLLGPNDLIRFVPTSNTFTGLVSLLVHAWDGTGSITAGGTANLSKPKSTGGTTPFSSALLTGKLFFNHAPAQKPPAGAITLPAIAENAPSKAVSVATLLKDAQATDVDRGEALGLALTSASGPGFWQYELPRGVWQNMPASLSAAAVLLLPSAALLRFNPAVNQSGSATLSWEAWDGTQGTAGETFALPTGNGGASAFSTASATATLTIKSSPQPPAWTAGSVALLPVRPTDIPPGETVASIFGSVYADANPTVGIAITGVKGVGFGQWQYSTDGKSWTNVPSVSANQALLLTSSDFLRFLPNDKGLGTATLTAYAWDGGGTGNAPVTRVRVQGSNFSSKTLIATCLVNDAPILSA
jgi:hypothetical protein